MDHETYLAGIAELCAAEVFRPLLARHGLDLVEDGGARRRPDGEFHGCARGTVVRIAQREATGDASMDRELLTMLSYPLIRRSQ